MFTKAKVFAVAGILIVSLLGVSCTKSASSSVLPVNEATTQARETALASLVASQTSTPAPTETPFAPSSPTPSPEPTQTATPTPGPIFADVPEGHPYRKQIETVYLMGALGARSDDPLTFGLEDSLTRTDMALAICKVRYADESLPLPVGAFEDVSAEAQTDLAACVEQLYREEIIDGCRKEPNLRFCPTRTLTFAEFSVFLLRAIHGGGWQPPDYQGWEWGYYTQTWQAKWGEALIREGYWDLGQGRFLASNSATKNSAANAIYLFAQNSQAQK